MTPERGSVPVGVWGTSISTSEISVHCVHLWQSGATLLVLILGTLFRTGFKGSSAVGFLRPGVCDEPLDERQWLQVEHTLRSIP